MSLPTLLSSHESPLLGGLSFGGVPVLRFSMLADVADLAQLRSGGKRDEGRRSRAVARWPPVEVGCSALGEVPNGTL